MSKRAPLSVTPTNPWVEILRPGTHTSMSGKAVTFTDADVSARAGAIKTQLTSGFTPPLVIGHPRHDSPRVGSVVDAKYEGGIAYAKVDELTPEFAEACRKGEYKYNSPAFYAEGGLRHLGILGAWNPAMKEQSPIAFGEGMFAESDAASAGSADDVLLFASPADWGTVVGGWMNRLAWRINSLGTILRRLRDNMIEEKGLEAADKILPAYEIDNLNELKVPYDLNPQAEGEAIPAAFGDPAPTPAPAAPPAPATEGNPPVVPAVQDSPAAPAAVTLPVLPSTREAELQAQLDEANNRLAQVEAERAQKQFGERLDKAAHDGRLSPVLRTRLEKLHASVAGGDLAFGEGEPARTALEELVDSLPQIVAFGELPVGTSPKPINPLLADAEARHTNGARS